MILVEQAEHDDIFVLRYVLSYKNKDETIQRIRKGLEYRKANPWLALAKEGKPHPEAEKIKQYTCASFHGTHDGGPIQVIRAGLTNVSALYEVVDVKYIIEEMTLSKEEAYIQCDKVTRQTGRLTKQIVIFDMNNVGWIYPSQTLIGSQNEASEIAKNLFPQLLEKVVIINQPWFFTKLWNIARSLLSTSLTGKVGLCAGTIVDGGADACPYVKKHIDDLSKVRHCVLVQGCCCC